MTKQVVLMFHGIGDPRQGIPSEEVPYWISRDLFREIVELVRDRPDVLLTFDDGNSSDLNAAEVLAANCLSGKFYVLTGRFDQPGYLSPADLRTLDQMGMEVGLHGADHVDWRKINSKRLSYETESARDLISEALSKPVRSVAIPFGAYNKPVHRHLKNSAFERIYTSDRGVADTQARFVRRNPVMGWHTLRDIENIIEDRISLPARVRRTVMPIIKRNIH